MRCDRCKRPLRAATIQISGCNYGPKCADLMGLSTTKTKRTRKVRQSVQVQQDKNQFELMLEWMP